MSQTRIYIPKDSAARSVGADEVAEAIEIESVKRGLPLSIIRNGSRGALWLEPLVEVETDQGRMAYGPVSAEDVSSLFDSAFHVGHEHPLSLGLTKDLAWLARQDRFTFERVGLIDPLSIADYQDCGGLVGLRRALEIDPEAIVAEVTDSGLRGRGGAGFPAGIKWRTVLATPGDQKFICCNADEGDSGTFADRMLMEGDPFTLLEGMTIAGIAVGATQGVIYIRSEYPDAIATIRDAIEIAREFGWLGRSVLGTPHTFDIRVRTGGGSYV